VEKRGKPVETKAKEKKVPLNLYVAPEVKEAVERHAENEERTPSNLADRLLGWCVRWLNAAGDSQSLLRWQVRPGHSRSRRVSDELQEDLYTALGTIIERAPSAVVEDVAEVLTSRAGQYGEEIRNRPRGPREAESGEGEVHRDADLLESQTETARRAVHGPRSGKIAKKGKADRPAGSA
jgi:hypothetical protein